MTATAEGFYDESPAASSLYCDVMIDEASLKVEGTLGAFGFLLDHFRIVRETVRRFFICYQNDFARKIVACIIQRLQRGDRNGIPALHVKNARSIGLAVFDREWTLLYFPFIENGIHVSHQNDIRLR